MKLTNGLPAPVSIDVSINGSNFKRSSIQPGHAASHVFVTQLRKGEVVDVTGTITIGTSPPTTIDLSSFDLQATIGKTNSIVVSTDGGIIKVTNAVS